MTIKCRSCTMDYGNDTHTRHRLIDAGLLCPLCNYRGKWCSHINEDLWGDSLECKKCHDYILYVSPDNQIWKDEIYLPQDRYLIRHLETNTSSLFVGLKEITTLDYIVQFQTLRQLINRIQTIVVFS